MSKLNVLAEALKKRKAIFIVLASLVVSLTTYSLILPAFTLDEKEAKEQGGIDVEEQIEETSAKDSAAEDEAPKEDEKEAEVKTADESKNKAESDVKVVDNYENHTLETESKEYGITLSYDKDAKIPENAELKATEIKQGRDFDALYKKANKAVQDASDKDVDTKIKEIKFYDIQIEADGKEIEPSSKVDVLIDYEKGLRLAGASEEQGNIKIVHFTEDKDGKLQAELLDEKDYSAEIKKDKLTSCEFSAESFSVYGIIYTVDFEYKDEETGKTYTYSIEGESSITLKELFAILGIKEDVKDVKDVTFSDDKLIKVSKKLFSNDWTLKSLKPFLSEETLTITMKNGAVYTIKVTDAQETTSPWNLANTDNTQFLHVSAESSVTQNEQSRDAAFKLTFTYSLEEDVVHAIDNYEGNPVLVYDLNSLIDRSPIGSIRNNLNGIISIGSRKLGTYTVDNGVITLTFTDPSYFDGRSSFTGFFNVTVETSETELGSYDEWTYEFPGTTDTIPIHYKKTVEEGTKSVNSVKNSDGSYTLHYTANIRVNSDLDSMVFNDTLGGLQTLDASSVKINGNSVSVSQSGQNFSFNVANALGTTGVAKGNYQVTYDTTVTEDQLKEMSQDKTTETNTVKWTVNGDKEVPGGDTSVEIDKPREPIPVVKTVNKTSAQPGDSLTYTVTYGKDTTALSEFHISDYMTDVVVPQGKVTLSYNGQTTEIDFDAQATNNSYSKSTVPLFDYTFPAGTAGNGPVTATYTVKLIDADTAKSNGIYDVTEVTNTAQEHRQNTTDSETTTVTYEKEPHYTVVKSVSADPDGSKWEPGTTLSYTLTVGDADTNMAGVNIKDMISDQQILDGDIMIKIGNGSLVKLSDYVADAIKWNDDGNYSDNRVTLFDFNMPSDAGNGPVVITYQTKIINQSQASDSGIYGEHTIQNTGSGGNDSDSTSHTGIFDDFPISKQVTQGGSDVNGQTVESGSTVHYTLTFGEAGMDLKNALIEDYMTDIQKLISPITIKKADGTEFIMPTGTGQWSEGGNNWAFWDDGNYNVNQRICLFRYRLPSDIGEGPITIEYDAQIISDEEAKEAGITDTQSAFNEFRHGGFTSTTEVKIDFPREVTHDPKVSKAFDHWDVENSKVYWNITVEKDKDSAYPLENVTVRESTDRHEVSFKSEAQGVWYHQAEASEFDIIHAVVTTDDGTILTPGVDYSIDKDNALFSFPLLTERVHINLAYQSPYKIVNGTYMKNKVRLNNDKEAEAEATYQNPNVEIIKNGQYSESSRILEWTVQLNPSAVAFTDSEPLRVMFTDAIPNGLTLLNSETHEETNPSLHVSFPGKGYSHNVPVTVDNNNVIVPVDIAAHQAHGSQEFGLNGNKIVINYWTKLSDEEWDRITSSASGSEAFKNKVTVTAGDNEKFEATDNVTVTSDGYITKEDTTVEQGGIVIDPESDSNSKNITYRVEINPNGYKLNSGNALSLTDYIATNMDLDTSSVEIQNATMGDDGKLEPTGSKPSGLNVSYNDDSRLLSITNIPDNTPLLLTYTCIARAQGQDTFTNTATLIGGGSHSASTREEHTVQTNDAGVKIDGIDMNLHKIDENNIAKDLQGAKFQLYECELAIGELTNPDTYPQSWWDALLAKVDKRTAGDATAEEIAEINRDFKITNYKPIGDPVVTGVSGYTQWSGLNEHKLYAWKEVEAPDNYTGNEDYHYFVGYQHIDVNSDELPQPLLPDNEQLNRKHAAWALDDACQFANGIRIASMSNLTTWTATNVQSDFTSISATKSWENDSDNLFETRPEDGIKLQLVRINADGTRENVGTPVAINVNKETGEWPSYIWNRLPVEDSEGNKLKYTVTEEKVADYSTTYSDDGKGKTSGEIVVTNRMIPKSTNIHVHKRFEVPDGDVKPEQIKVNLMVIKTDKNGVAGEPEDMNMEGYLHEENNWSCAFEKLDTTQVINGQPYTLTYTVVEDTAALERQGFNYEVSYSDNGEGVVETTSEDPLVVTNTKETGKITVKKTFSGVDNATDLAALQNGLTVTVSGKDVGGPGTDTLTLTWDDVKDNGKEITGLPLNEEYAVTETISADGVLPRYEVTSQTVSSATVTSTKDGQTAELKNIYEYIPPTGSLNIKKTGQVNGATPTVDNKDKIDGNYSFVVAGKTDTATANNVVNVKITLTNGVATAAEKIGTSTPADATVACIDGIVAINGLPLGDYIVTENLTSEQTAAGIKLSDNNNIEISVSENPETIPTALFTNNAEIGKLQIRKELSYNEGAVPENRKPLYAGDYTFTVCKDEHGELPYPDSEHPMTFTVHIGNNAEPDESEIKELPAGKYWIRENVAEDAQILPLGVNPKEITVSAGEDSTTVNVVTVTNDLHVNESDDELTLDIEKKFSGIDGRTEIPHDFQIVITYKLDGEDKTIVLKCEESHVTTDGHKVVITHSDDGLSWKWHVYGIDEDSTDVKVKEINYTKSGYDLDVSYNGTPIVNPDKPDTEQTVPLTAGEPATLTEVEGRKTSQTSMNHYILDNDYAVLIAITGNVQGTAVVSKRSLNMAERDAITRGIENIEHGPFTNDHMWFYSEEEHFVEGQDVIVTPVHNRNLTFSSVDGEHIIICPPSSNKQAIAYSIVYDGGKPSITNSTYTNDYTEIGTNLNVVKVEKDNAAKTLPGAKFKATLLDEDQTTAGNIVIKTKAMEGETETVPVFSKEFGPTDDEGKLTVDNLAAGYYMIEESQSPDGYVISDDPTFYIHVADGAITYLIRSTAAADASKKMNEWETSDTGSGLVSYDKDTMTATVENEPGAELPHAGGPGTTWMYMLGALLVLASVIAMLARYKAQK